MLSIIIPASNEEAYIGACLHSIFQSDLPADLAGLPLEVIVVANGCTDNTGAIVRQFAGMAESQGWHLQLLELDTAGKLTALNAGDAAATGTVRLYVDADVTVEPALVAQLWRALDRPEPAYGSGTITVLPGRSLATRIYGRVWSRLPFMTDDVPGCGVYAVNAAGRARWGDFPSIINDDAFVRLHFTPEERIAVPARFFWPLPEGLENLRKVRRRVDAGSAELQKKFPSLIANEGKPPVSRAMMAQLAVAMPVSFASYLAILLSIRLSPDTGSMAWARSR
ncbi:MAG: glycosyltransferase [Alphaproteobacteria bacterium]